MKRYTLHVDQCGALYAHDVSESGECFEPTETSEWVRLEDVRADQANSQLAATHLWEQLSAAFALLDRCDSEGTLPRELKRKIASQLAAPARTDPPPGDMQVGPGVPLVRTRWRTGTKNPHNLYLDDKPAAFVLDADLAKLIAERLECFPTVEIARRGLKP